MVAVVTAAQLADVTAERNAEAQQVQLQLKSLELHNLVLMPLYCSTTVAVTE
jgi:hypothetical protein